MRHHALVTPLKAIRMLLDGSGVLARAERWEEMTTTMTTPETRYWTVDREPGGWSFTYICHESGDLFPTREDALEGLVNLLAEDNQRLMLALDAKNDEDED